MQLSQPGVTAEAAEAFIAEQERIRAGGEITIPPELLEVARATELAGRPDQARAQARRPDRDDDPARSTPASRPSRPKRSSRMQEAAPVAAAQVQLDLSWMKVPTEWGIRVKPGKKGLTVGMINVGTYGDVPDYWPYQTEMPRGAYPIPGVPSHGLLDLREGRALGRQLPPTSTKRRSSAAGAPATDIPWNTIEPLPDDVEQAICQLCTAPLREGADRRRHHRQVAAGDVLRLPRSEALPLLRRVRRSAPVRGLPQARALQRRRHGHPEPRLLPPRDASTRASGRRSRSAMFILHNSYIMGLYEMGAVRRAQRGRGRSSQAACRTRPARSPTGSQHLQVLPLPPPRPPRGDQPLPRTRRRPSSTTRWRRTCRCARR